MKRFSGVLQFVIGFFLGLTIFVGGISLLGYFVFSRLASTPPRPTFPEENKVKTVKKPEPKAVTTDKGDTKKTKENTATTSETKAAEKPKSETSPSPEASPSPTAEVSPSPSPTPVPSSSPEAKKEALPAGAYHAKVIRSEGLSLRSNPSKEAERIGGVDYNANLIVLEKSTDGEWVKVKSADGGQEGWVRAGNLKKEE